jgi:hypothetical protein
MGFDGLGLGDAAVGELLGEDEGAPPAELLLPPPQPASGSVTARVIMAAAIRCVLTSGVLISK